MPPPDKWHLLARYVVGDASDDEERALRAWVNDDPGRQAMLRQVQDVYEAGGEEAVEQINVDAAWQRVSSRIGKPSGVSSPSRRTDRRPTVHARRRRTRRKAGLAVVAMAVLAIALSPWLFTQPASDAEEPWRTVTTGVGEQATIELYDGTVVRLNAGSTVHYPPAFDDEERVIELDGEAYVEAASNPDRPFIVRVATPPHVEAQVLGTSFLVKGYGDEEYTRVAVSEGRVAVASGSREPVVLEVSDMAEVKADGERVTRRGIDLATHLSWLEGRLIFEDTPLNEAVAAISRRYGVAVRLADASLEDRPITATFDRRDTIDDVIDVLARTLDLRIDQTEEGIVLSEVSSR